MTVRYPARRGEIPNLSAYLTTSSSVGALSDVDLTGAADNDLLFRSGGNWIDTAGRLTWNGSAFRIYDATLTDYSTSSHDGTDFNTTFSGTTDWNIDGLTGDIKLVNAVDLDFLGGGRLIVRDTGGTDYVIQRHDGTDFHFDFTNTGTVLFENNTADFFVLDFTNDRWIAYAPMFMQEQAAANADTASFGQLWVKNDTPNTLWFTDDAGTDWQLNTAAGLTSPVGATDGGTGITTYTTGDILYASATNTLSKLAAGTTGYVLTMGASVPAWAAASGSSNTQTKYKTSTETVTNSATLQDDDHITGFTLEAGAKYKVEGWFYWLSNSTTTDIKFAMSFSSTPVTQVWMGHGATSSNGSIAGEYTSMAGNLICQSIAGTNAIQVAGYIAANGSTGGTCKLQWAQNTAALEDTDLYAGSWLSLTKIS